MYINGTVALVSSSFLVNTCTSDTGIHFDHCIRPICMRSIDSVIGRVSPEQVVVSVKRIERGSQNWKGYSTMNISLNSAS